MEPTRDTFQLADVFIRMSRSNIVHAEEQMSRFLDLVFGSPTTTPTADEHAMYLAYAASLRSADLSRQVGAAILSGEDDLIAVGANDVPRADGGLYWPGPEDRRDHVRHMDSNELRKVEIARDIYSLLFDGDRKRDFKTFLEQMERSLLFDITEYGRAVHAEMEALLSCARTGTSPRRGTLYSTTFPCHNCAKHIIAAGLRRVVYVEPYPKSQALVLHDDAISIEEPHSGGDAVERRKVVFEPYIGVGPRRYMDLFSMKLGSGRRMKRKEKGKLVSWDRTSAFPRVPESESVQELERRAVSLLKEKLEAVHETEETNEL